MEGMTMTTTGMCRYCYGAGGNEENLDHQPRCPRFGQPPAEVPALFGVGGIAARRSPAETALIAEQRRRAQERQAGRQSVGQLARERFEAANAARRAEGR